MSKQPWEKIPKDELEIVRKHCHHDLHYENKSVEFVREDESYELRCCACGFLTASIPYKKLMERYLQDIDGPLCCAMCGCYMKKGEPHSMDDGEPVHSKCLWGDDW